MISLAHFEMRHNCKLEKPSQESKIWPHMHASLDGLWRAPNILVESKAPAFWKHTMALCGLVPDTYVDQLQAQLFVYESELNYYVSFHDGQPESHQYAEVAVGRDEKRIKEIVERCKYFWVLVERGIWYDGF